MNSMSQLIYIEIEIIHKWKGGIPNLVINPNIRVSLIKLDWKKNNDL